MPTAAGWTTLAAAVAAALIGRLFAIPALFIAAAALVLIPFFGLIAIWLRPGRIDVERRISPGTLIAGEAGIQSWVITNHSKVSSPSLLLDTELVIRRPGQRTASKSELIGLQVGPIAPEQSTTLTTAVVSPHRGVLDLLPVYAERVDLFGTVRRRIPVCPAVEVPVLPATISLAAPALGRGSLGRLLIDRARRLGLEEFEGLRQYAVGDEPRSIHWRASARTGDLKVREHSTDGIRRCVVAIDTSVGDEDELDLLTGAAASIIETATSVGLNTRLVASGGLDLRGPNIASDALGLLARLDSGPPIGYLERDPGDGLGLAIILAAHHRRGAEIAVGLGEMSLVSVVISTSRPDQDQRGSSHPGLAIVACSLTELQRCWRQINGGAINSGDTGIADLP